jgi:5-(carboxyamino)imidazole ribonucleotide mutase
MKSETPVVGVVMGSDSDWVVMEEAAKILVEFGIAYEIDVSSAHRMPEETISYGKSAISRGLKVIIAGAGGAAHLPGVLAALTRLPVIGVPIAVKNLDGLDSLLSIVQMPGGVPVATVGIGSAKNAALLAVRILAVTDEILGARLEEFADKQRKAALEKGAALRARLGNRTGF